MNEIVISCEQCRGLLRVPTYRDSTEVICPRCHAKFLWSLNPKTNNSPQQKSLDGSKRKESKPQRKELSEKSLTKYI